MFTQTALTIRLATAEDRQKLANLIHFEIYVHRHLDWRPPLEWIGYEPYLVVERKRSLIAALACPPDPPGVGWIRLFAVAADYDMERAWHPLWEEAQARLRENPNVRWAAAIPLQAWFERLIRQGGFRETHQVVMLNWEAPRRAAGGTNGSSLATEVPAGVTLRPMTFDDMDAVEAVDVASFVPVWQNSKDSLELAFRQAAVATVAERESEIVGYQISTATPLGGHLARLAVHPAEQGRRIGQALLGDLLSQFVRRGAQAVTVNTQKDNQASLGLYQKMGFYLTGEAYPIYQFDLHE